MFVGKSQPSVFCFFNRRRQPLLVSEATHSLKLWLINCMNAS